MTTWEDVIKLPSFQELEPDEQVQIRAEWYDANVTPKYIEQGLSEEDFAAIRQKDITEFDNGQGYITSFAGAVGRGALGTVSSAIQGIGALSQDPSTEEFGTQMQQGVENVFEVNPSMTKTNFAGQVVGNVGAMLATGGTGGVIGRGLGAAGRGAEIASLGTGFLAGAGQGAQEADQYGITGEDRVARAFLGGAAEVFTEKIPGLGMGTELRAISRIPGLSEVASGRTGTLLGAVGSETIEEVAAQGAGNLSTNLLKPAGVEGPAWNEGFAEAAAGGALGGGLMGGIGLIGSPPPSVKAATLAEQAGDPGAAAVLQGVQKLVPVTAPEVAPAAEGDTTALDEIDFEKFAAENPVLPLTGPAETGLATGTSEPGMEAGPTEPELATGPAETGLATGASEPGLEAGAAETGLATGPTEPELATGPTEPGTPTPVEVAPAGAEQAAVPDLLTQEAEAVLPTPPVTEEQLREESRLIDTSGRITEETGMKMTEAFKRLGVGGVDVIFNDTGKPPGSTIPQLTRGGRYTVDGQQVVYLNRNDLRKDTPVHEVIGHGVMERLGELMPDLDAQARAILTGSPLEAAIKARYTREGVSLTPDELFNEAKATLIGNQGADVFEAYANNGEFVRALKEWWAKFRAWLDTHLAKKGIDPNMTLEQFAKKVNRLILAGQLREPATNVRQQEENRQENDQGQKLLGFSESLLESLPERARAAWSQEDLAAADRFAETGDRSALSGLNPVKQKRAMEHRENLRKPLGPQYSLNARDTEYLAAVERGDMETAQRMVDEAAAAAGYTIKDQYHASITNFTEFLDARERAELEGEDPYDVDVEPGNLGTGFYFTPDETYAKRFGSPRKFHLKIDNLLDVTDEDVISRGQEIMEDEGLSVGDTMDELIREGRHDGAYGEGVGGLSYGAAEFMIKKSSQAKLADPVIKDDNGNVIPLSRRFQQSSSDIRFSIRPSGLAANQPGTKVAAMAATYTYQAESAGPAFAQAEKLYNEGGTFEQQLAKLNELVVTSGKNGIMNMTPGCYFGLMLRDLTAMRDNPDAPETERAQADRSLDKLMAVMTEVAAAAGQKVKGFDFGLIAGNSPLAQVRAADRLVPFDGSEEKRKEFDTNANVVTSTLGELNQEALTTAPVESITNKFGEGISDVIRGQDAADAGAVQLDIAAEQVDEQAMPDWYLTAISQADASVRTTVEALMEEFMFAALLEAEGDFSLTPGQEANRAIRERALARLAAVRAAGTSKATALAESKKRQAELARKLAVKPKAPTPQAPADESDIAAMAVDRAVKMLTQLTSAPAKPKQATVNKLIAKAITDSVFAKIGLVPPPSGTADSMALTVGLLLANQEIAASLVQDTMARISLDPNIAGLITLPKLKAFFQATIGKEFTTVDGTTTSSAPYGEKQIADLLKAELKTAEVNLNKVVLDAALQRQTADQLEAQLRDPKRSFAKILSPEAMDKMVAAVRAEFDTTARARAERLSREQAEESVRMRMEEDQRQQREFADLEARQAEQNAKIAQEEVRKAMEAETRAAAQWEREKSKQNDRIKADAKKAVLKAMKAFRVAKEKQEAAAAREAQQKVRDAIAEQTRAIRKDEAYRARLRREARRKAIRTARRKGLKVALDAEELAKLQAQPKNKIIDYLAREFGYDLSEVTGIAREADRYATIEAMTLKLADSLGLDQQQTEAFLKPVIAEAMKTVDAKRKAEAKRKVEAAVKRMTVKTKKDIPTEAQKLIRLAELGGLTAENVEVLLLDSMDAKKFSPEFKQTLVDLITKANDPNLPLATRDQLTAAYLNAIRSARGVSAVGLAGEWIMSNIFMSANTFKVNALWGGIKAIADSAVFLTRLDPFNVAPGAQLPKGARQALVRQMLRGFTSDLQYQAKYIAKTGMSKLESDYTTQFSNSDFELLAQMPDTEIRAWLNGDPISPAWAKMAKKMAAFSKWTRRIMVATDIVNRTPAYEMLKAQEIIKFIAKRGTNVPSNAKEWQKAIDDALYGGDFKAAKEAAFRKVDAAIADGRVAKQERGIYFGEVMDEMLAENLKLTPTQLNEMLARAQDSAKRWTVANATEGILGGISNFMLTAVRDIPGLKFLLPAIRMPIGAFSQGLDWSPYGFLRYRAIKSSGFKTASYSNLVFNKAGKRNWNQPAAGIPEEQIIETLNKAMLGTAMMIAMAIAAAASFDDDEDEAAFFITGKGPEDPQKNRLWRDKGNKPFMVRINGVAFNFQESPMYPMLTTLGAWSDAHRYGKPEDTESDRLFYAMSKSIAGFGDAAVLKSFQDALAAVSGGSGYTAASASENAAKTFGRLVSVVAAPRLGNEINTILYGPQDTKEGGWAARMLANVPFVPAVLAYPALNWFGEEITVQRGGPMGEILPLLAHRVSPQLTDDEQMRFVAKIGANKLTTTRRTQDGVEVMEQPKLVRQWAKASGAAVRQWLTPQRMAEFEAMRVKDVKTAEEAFDKEVRRIREAELRRIPGVVF